MCHEDWRRTRCRLRWFCCRSNFINVRRGGQRWISTSIVHLLTHHFCHCATHFLKCRPRMLNQLNQKLHLTHVKENDRANLHGKQTSLRNTLQITVSHICKLIRRGLISWPIDTLINNSLSVAETKKLKQFWTLLAMIFF